MPAAAPPKTTHTAPTFHRNTATEASKAINSPCQLGDHQMADGLGADGGEQFRRLVIGEVAEVPAHPPPHLLQPFAADVGDVLPIEQHLSASWLDQAIQAP